MSSMKKWVLFLAVFGVFASVNASWYWPFGSDDDSDGPRLSELMEPASELIDDAADLASDGKIQESVAKYREALDELAKVELDNPDRAATTEFASLRNKRAYVNAAIDSLLLAEARANAKAVAITDTTELEKKFLRKRGLLPPEEKPVAKAPEAKAEPVAPEAKSDTPAVKPDAKAHKSEKEVKPARKAASVKIAEALKKDPKNRKLRLALIGEHIKAENFDKAKEQIDVLLKANMTDSSALNLKAVCEAAQGDFKSAEKTLDFAIQSNPRDYNGYYNMANLKLQGSDNKNVARYYYETGRAVGGPKDAELEAAMEE